MRIIGNGFLARQLEAISHLHPHAVLLAAGVSDVGLAAPVAFEREALLVRDSARECRRTGRTLVLFSTASAGLYGTPRCTGREECSHPTTPYGHHKLAMERLARSSGCSWLILRIGHLVGPGQSPHQLIPALVRQVESGEVCIFRDTRRDLLDVRDFISMIDGLLALRVTDEMINLASGSAVPVDDIVTHIAAVLKREPRRTYVDLSRDHYVSVQKLRHLLSKESGGHAGYRAVLDRYVPLYASKSAVHGSL
ncbi:NAD-dependent epimerase/dehydratase family protein [Streptomyces sp. YGL11-2]|uniref:NAD-dependent epimerase/dehydratase family protein n=1 Tax=Streptomyces sp. YGL11-2 TaxID=3414028 RepID=UPI003CF7DC58